MANLLKGDVISDGAYLINGLACALCHDAIQVSFVEHDLLSLYLDVDSLSTGPSKGLMDHDSGIGHAVALALCTRCQQECAHGCCQAKAVCGDISSTHLQTRDALGTEASVLHEAARNRDTICSL